MRSAVLVAQPVPAEDEIPKALIDPWIEAASDQAMKEKVHGGQLTPFLLNRIYELSDGKSLRANLSLLLNNAHLGGRIAKALAATRRNKHI
jgi:pseudouridine-5'-phosphate glycosidase